MHNCVTRHISFCTYHIHTTHHMHNNNEHNDHAYAYYLNAIDAQTHVAIACTSIDAQQQYDDARDAITRTLRQCIARSQMNNDEYTYFVSLLCDAIDIYDLFNIATCIRDHVNDVIDAHAYLN